MSKLFRLVLLNIIILEIVTKEESNQVNNSTNPEIIHCKKPDDCLSYHDCIENICLHKKFSPIRQLEALEYLGMSIVSAPLMVFGLGGGGVYVGLILSINHFTSQYAAPIASFIIMICSLTVLVCGIRYHLYLENPHDEMFIDYELGNLVVPIILLGSKIGCLLNFIMPDIITCLFLLVVLAYNTFNSTYSRAKKVKFKENFSNQNQMEFRFNERFNLHSENGSFEMTQSLSLLQFKKVSSYISQSTTAPGSRKIRQNEEIISEMQKNINDQLNQMATEENQPYRSDIIIDTIKYFGILVIDLLIETKLADKLGFSGCSLFSFTFFCIYIIISSVLSRYNLHLVKTKQEYKQMLDKCNIDKKIQFIINDYSYLLFSCFTIGLLQGFLGIGSGVLFIPLLLEIGNSSYISANTSNYLVFVASFGCTVTNFFLNKIVFDYALFIGILCGIVTYFFSGHVIKFWHINKRQSFVLFGYCLIVGINFIFLIVIILQRVIYEREIGKDIFAFTINCN